MLADGFLQMKMQPDGLTLTRPPSTLPPSSNRLKRLVQYLPTPEEQEWLLDGLALLIEKRGHGHFVTMPIVEPTPAYFPDRWNFSPVGLDRVVRRLMQYANLTDLQPRLLTFVQATQERDTGQGAYACHTVAGAFLGIDGQTCSLAFNEQAPPDAEYMAGVIAHEVAHVYRAFHGLWAETLSREEEECLTDVTAVYLGFGILTANISFRTRTSGTNVGYRATFKWSTQRVGYLTPQAFAYLIAVQMIVRNFDKKRCRQLLKHIEPDQAAFAQAAFDMLIHEKEKLAKHLKLPARSLWVPSPDLSEILQPLPEAELYNAGRPVNRTTKAHMGLYGILGIVAGIVAAVVVVVAWDSESALMLPLIGLAAGIWWGHRNRVELCSNPDCQSVLPPGAAICPQCEGQIVNTEHPDISNEE